VSQPIIFSLSEFAEIKNNLNSGFCYLIIDQVISNVRFEIHDYDEILLEYKNENVTGVLLYE
jgi:hypothetical protein